MRTTISIMYTSIFIISVAFIITAIILFLVNNRNQRICSIHTTAEVVDIKFRKALYGHGIDRMRGWSPVFKYYIDGEEITHISNIYYSDKDKFYIGQKVNIYVDPNNKDKFYCDYKTMIYLTNIFAVVGVFLLLMSAYLYFR